MANPYALDFAPVNNALVQWQARNQAADRMAQQQQQFEASNKLAQARLAQDDSHFGMNYNLKDRQLANALALDEERKKLIRAQAGYYNTRSNALGMGGGVPPKPETPEPELGMRPDGTIYVLPTNVQSDSTGAPNVENKVLGVRSTLPAFAPQLEHMYFGKIGMKSSDVPGVVTTPKGVSDRFATEQAQGQRAIDGNTSIDRERAIKFRDTQLMWTNLHGSKPRAGYMYDDQGREVPRGPLSNAADRSERQDRAIGNVQTDIAEAEKTLTSGLLPGVKRTLAPALKELGVPGRVINNILSLEDEAEAYNKIKMGVMQTVYALSGKQTTNKEMDAFIDNFMPLGGESEPMLKSKLGRLTKFLTTLRSNVKKGMVYDDAQNAAIGAAVNSTRTSPAQNPFKSKYHGLE